MLSIQRSIESVKHRANVEAEGWDGPSYQTCIVIWTAGKRIDDDIAWLAIGCPFRGNVLKVQQNLEPGF